MKKQKLLNSILESAGPKIQSELSGLLDRQITLAPPSFQLLSKEEFFDEALKKLVLTRLSMEGERSGEGYFLALARDAILLGGTLIMLPPSELDERVNREEFGEEEEDAFGEIANIIAGALTSTFDELYPEKMRVVKKALEAVIPTKVTAESPEPFEEQSLYLATYALSMDGQKLAPFQLLLPAALLGLSEAPKEAPPVSKEEEPLSAPAQASPSKAPEEASQAPTIKRESQASGLEKAFSATKTESAVEPPPEERGKPVILIVGDSADAMAPLPQILEDRGFEIQRMNFKDDVRGNLPGRVCGAFLMMEKVGEQGFAAAIKIKSACGTSLPLIAAGPQWTRRTVLQAVRYGICDILLMPATPEEIQEKVERNIQMPAEA